MRILFYIEPWSELSNPMFRFNCIKNTLNKQVISLQSFATKNNISLELEIIVSDSILQELEAQNRTINGVKYHTIGEFELKKIFPNYLTAQCAWQNGTYTKKQLTAMQGVIKDVIGNFEPDFILTWETPVVFLEKMFPKASILYEMPGIFSRAPFANTYTIDTLGLFKNSILKEKSSFLKDLQINSTEETYLNTFKRTYTKLFDHYNPWKSFIKNHKKKFSKLVLLPLQITNYFSFYSACDFKSQYEYLVHVLENISPEIGVVVTQYNAGVNSDPAVKPYNQAYLERKFPNFIFNHEFDLIDFPSTVLLSSVDAVITVASNVGLQAMLWNKPFFTVGESSHVSALAQGHSIEEVNDFLLNNKTPKNLDAALHWILTHAQPLAEEQAHNGKWLYETLQYIQEHKELPQVQNTEEYFKSISLPRKNVIEKKLKEANLLEEVKTFLPAKLIEEVKNPKYEVISFDIFDTLLIRPLCKPVDIFKMIEPRVREITQIPYLDFVEERRNAEIQTREKSKHPHDEVTFDEIYKTFRLNLGITREQAKEIQKLELDTEKTMLYRREAICHVFHEAVAMGKKVIITSDMYLPEEEIVNILQENFITGYHKLYLSSTLTVKKHDGRLFKHILADLKISPSQMLHIGDNHNGDFLRAQECKIAAHKTVHDVDNLLIVNTAYNTLLGKRKKGFSLSESMAFGLIAHKFFHNHQGGFSKATLFNGSAYNLGYAGASGIFLSFTQWILERAIKQGIKTLYFLARDGLIIKKIYDTISPFYPNAPKSEYLYCSRRAMNVAKIKSRSDILAIVNSPFGSDTIANFLSNKFGLNVELYQEQIKNAGFRSSLQTINRSIDKQAIIKLLFSIEEDIYANCSKEREAMLEYLENKRVGANEKQALVDIGYAATMQKSLSQLINCKIGGYYLMTFERAKELEQEGLEFEGMLGNLVPPAYADKIQFFRPLYETIFSNTEGSLICMKKQNGKIVPVLQSTAGEERRCGIVAQLQQGAIDFVQDLTTKFKERITSFYISPFTATQVFDAFITNPHPKDAKIFEGVVFEDNYGGVGVRYIVPPRKGNKYSEELLASSIWKAGTKSLFEDHETQMRQEKEAKTPHAPKPVAPTVVKPKAVQSIQPKTAVVKALPKQTVLYKTAKFFVQRYASEKKYNKFLKSPRAFFEDSQNKFANKISKFF